jgi:hypothetical protein
VEIPRDDQLKARTEAYGDWKNWFLAEDVRILEPIYAPYRELVGYDSGDWPPNPHPTITPALASEYMKHLSVEGRFERLEFVRDRGGRLCETAASFVGRHPS